MNSIRKGITLLFFGGVLQGGLLFEAKTISQSNSWHEAGRIVGNARRFAMEATVASHLTSPAAASDVTANYPMAVPPIPISDSAAWIDHQPGKAVLTVEEELPQLRYTQPIQLLWTKPSAATLTLPSVTLQMILKFPRRLYRYLKESKNFPFPMDITLQMTFIEVGSRLYFSWDLHYSAFSMLKRDSLSVWKRLAARSPKANTASPTPLFFHGSFPFFSYANPFICRIVAFFLQFLNGTRIAFGPCASYLAFLGSAVDERPNSEPGSDSFLTLRVKRSEIFPPSCPSEEGNRIPKDPERHAWQENEDDSDTKGQGATTMGAIEPPSSQASRFRELSYAPSHLSSCDAVHQPILAVTRAAPIHRESSRGKDVPILSESPLKLLASSSNLITAGLPRTSPLPIALRGDRPYAGNPTSSHFSLLCGESASSGLNKEGGLPNGPRVTTGHARLMACQLFGSELPSYEQPALRVNVSGFDSVFSENEAIAALMRGTSMDSEYHSVQEATSGPWLPASFPQMAEALPQEARAAGNLDTTQVMKASRVAEGGKIPTSKSDISGSMESDAGGVACEGCLSLKRCLLKESDRTSSTVAALLLPSKPRTALWPPFLSSDLLLSLAETPLSDDESLNIDETLQACKLKIIKDVRAVQAKITNGHQSAYKTALLFLFFEETFMQTRGANDRIGLENQIVMLDNLRFAHLLASQIETLPPNLLRATGYNFSMALSKFASNLIESYRVHISAFNWQPPSLNRDYVNYVNLSLSLKANIETFDWQKHAFWNDFYRIKLAPRLEKESSDLFAA